MLFDLSLKALSAIRVSHNLVVLEDARSGRGYDWASEVAWDFKALTFGTSFQGNNSIPNHYSSKTKGNFQIRRPSLILA